VLMAREAVHLTAFFQLHLGAVVELGVQVET
jgi:hypothetical protein